MKRDGIKAGDKVKGKVLHARYSRYMQQVAEADPTLVERLAEVGARFTHHTSIAPTGTISLSIANNASNGIEPSFAHHYARNVIREGKKTKEKIDVYSYELLAYRELIDPRAMPHAGDDETACRIISSPPMTSPRPSTSTSRRRRRSGSTPASRKPPTSRPSTPTRTLKTSTCTPTTGG